jgi:hypothetical protein
MLSLLVAVASLIAWIVFAFILKVGPGAIHLLWALSATMFVRWWALRAPTGAPK